jgi:hypothetical protein
MPEEKGVRRRVSQKGSPGEDWSAWELIDDINCAAHVGFYMLQGAPNPGNAGNFRLISAGMIVYTGSRFTATSMVNFQMFQNQPVRSA